MQKIIFMTKDELIMLLHANNVGQAVDELSRLLDENPYFHTGHQLYIKSLQQTDLYEMDIQLNKAALIVRDRGVLYNYLNSSLNEIDDSQSKVDEIIEKIVDTEPEGMKVSSPAELIDSFLRTEPKIISNSDKEYKIDLSENTQENNDFCTETLADIYATQGYKNKAIEIYEKLILKNPEKHIYFAAQIKRLKE